MSESVSHDMFRLTCTACHWQADDSDLNVCPECGQTIDIIFVIVTGLVAWHGLTFRTKDGEREFVHLLFGCIALMYCLWVLFSDLLGLF